MQLYILLLCLCLISCGGHSKNNVSKKSETISVKSHTLVSYLYFSGIVQPLKNLYVTTPADGVVTEVGFHYGEAVTANQFIFGLSSDKYKTDYKNALMTYIKAKTDFVNNQIQLRESNFLHKNQLISDDDFKSKQTNYFNAQLGLVQAKESLTIYLKQMGLKKFELFSLSIENIDKINHELHEENDSQILRIVSPATGIALLPVKHGSNEIAIQKIVEGDQVKQGDVLAMIGDVSGLTIHINVNEFNINQLKIGQKVKVTGTAFPQFVLEGEISEIDRQGQATQGSVPIFPVEIVVHHLSDDERKLIHIGMSAKVEIRIEHPHVMTVPIAALIEKNGAHYLRIAKNHRLQDISVQTGETTQDEVVIVSNLKEGEQIVIAN